MWSSIKMSECDYVKVIAVCILEVVAELSR